MDELARQIGSARRPHSLGVQRADDGLDAHWTIPPIAFQIKREDGAYGLRLDRIDGKAFLDLLPAFLCIDDPVAERRARPVPEALAGILVHGS
ncbi:MAG: hypothetical protein P4M00_25720 [Azospirillaceae bacterium]|nr:hypothetical protein [Azospirillaceae bacterium]